MIVELGLKALHRTWGNTGAAAIEEARHCLDNGRCQRRYPDGAAGNPITFFETVDKEWKMKNVVFVAALAILGCGEEDTSDMECERIKVIRKE